MPENRKKSITREDIVLLHDRVCKNQKPGDIDKYQQRHNEFNRWLTDFIAAAKEAGKYPAQARLMQDMNTEEMAAYLNFFHWQLMEDFVRKHVESKEDNVNEYKIAATIQFVIMKYKPFEDSSGIPLVDLNVDFAFRTMLTIILNWHRNTLNLFVIKELFLHDKATRDFVQEHKVWLASHSIANNYVIFSNMQTIRMLHYWLQEPKENFISY